MRTFKLLKVSILAYNGTYPLSNSSIKKLEGTIIDSDTYKIEGKNIIFYINDVVFCTYEIKDSSYFILYELINKKYFFIDKFHVSIVEFISKKDLNEGVVKDDEEDEDVDDEDDNYGLDDEEIRCPHCGSNQLSTGKKDSV